MKNSEIKTDTESKAIAANVEAYYAEIAAAHSELLRRLGISQCVCLGCTKAAK